MLLYFVFCRHGGRSCVGTGWLLLVVAFCWWGRESSGALCDVLHRLRTYYTHTVHRLHTYCTLTAHILHTYCAHTAHRLCTFTMLCTCRLYNMPTKNSALFPAPILTKLTNAQQNRTKCHPNKTNKFKSADMILFHAQLTF